MQTRTALIIRITASIVLVLVIVALAVWFGRLQATPNPALVHYPGGTELVADYGSLVGSRVELYGRVVSRDPVLIRGTYSGRDLSVTVVDVETDPLVGQYLHVYGVVRDDHTIRALNTIVYPATGIVFTYAISALAGLWVVARFANRWQFSRQSLALERRDDTLVSVANLARKLLQRDNNA